jgi:hypothetical protein
LVRKHYTTTGQTIFSNRWHNSLQKIGRVKINLACLGTDRKSVMELHTSEYTDWYRGSERRNAVRYIDLY